MSKSNLIKRIKDLSLLFLEGGSFGFVDGVICSFGLIAGLTAATQNSTIILISGFLAGLSDSFGNSIGFFMSQKSEKTVQTIRNKRNKEHIHSEEEVFMSGLSSFLSTIITYALMLFPFLFLEINSALVLSLVMAIVLVFSLGAYNAVLLKKDAIKEGLFYVSITLVTAIISYAVGYYLNQLLLGGHFI